MKKMITVHISSVKFKLSTFLLNPSKLVKPFKIEETKVCQYLSLFTLIMNSHMTHFRHFKKRGLLHTEIYLTIDISCHPTFLALSTLFENASFVMYISTLWQYGLWSFQTGGTNLERFLPKNEHTQRKLLNLRIGLVGASEVFKNQSFKSQLFSSSQ